MAFDPLQWLSPCDIHIVTLEWLQKHCVAKPLPQLRDDGSIKFLAFLVIRFPALTVRKEFPLMVFSVVFLDFSGMEEREEVHGKLSGFYR